MEGDIRIRRVFPGLRLELLTKDVLGGGTPEGHVSGGHPSPAAARCGAHWDRAVATGTQLATGQDALIQLPPAAPMPGLLRTPQSEVNRSRTQPGCGILKSFPGGKRKKMK